MQNSLRRRPLSGSLDFSAAHRTRTSSSGYVIEFPGFGGAETPRARSRGSRSHGSASGRLSAAIAHEIRQPLSAMTGALKALHARLAPLDDDDRRLRPKSSRANRSDSIKSSPTSWNTPREKNYEFTDQNVLALLDETLMLFEHQPDFGQNYRIEREFKSKRWFARAWIAIASSKSSGIY